ncbi:MAG: aminotransferase class I/II-fold pyridoxal phosphate-dependent enzyme [Lachnospiraceae bacterium]|nr:aminotransferase class I/II-fold pyridoxal phosphate-dependent enzyme [Lachnospiraceae bacterium]
MPGHKRKWYPCDITEITGFDNLHNPTGLIRELELKAAEIYGVRDAFLLVNGSTAGNLASIMAAVKPGENVLIERDPHKSVHNGIKLAGGTEVIAFENDGRFIANTSSSTDELNGKAIVITTPSYEGVLKDISNAVKIKEETGAFLIIDSAHGAHLPFMGCDNSSNDGRKEKRTFAYCSEYYESLKVADAITVSLHKTLPAPTQTSLLLLPEGSRLNPEVVREKLRMIETSSPSYLLMAGISRCLRFLEEDAAEEFERYEEALEEFYNRGDGSCDSEPVISHESELGITRTVPGITDPTKIVIRGGDTGLSGEDIFRILRDEYKIECEMASEDYALAMSTVADTKEDLMRLTEAVKGIERTTGTVLVIRNCQNLSIPDTESQEPSPQFNTDIIAPANHPLAEEKRNTKHEH